MVCVVLDLAMAELDRLYERMAGRFARAEPRARVREYVSGLVAGLERKNGWTLAEQVRTYRAWYAHITLSMAALAWLAASKALAAKGESASATTT